MLVANVETFTIFPFTAHKILNVNANILINSMMLIRETVRHALANYSARIGLAPVEKSLMTIKLFQKINRLKKPKDKLFIIKWEEWCHIARCWMELIGTSQE